MRAESAKKWLRSCQSTPEPISRSDSWLTSAVGVAHDMAEPLAVLGFAFPMDTDYVGIPVGHRLQSVLVVVSLLRPRPAEAEWRAFAGDPRST